MRTSAVTALAYASLAAAFVAFWNAEPVAVESEGFLADVFITGLLLVHPITGFVVPRLWALGLPFVALAFSLPISEPDPELMGVTDAGVMFVGGVAAMILMSFGMACRLTLDAFREPR